MSPFKSMIKSLAVLLACFATTAFADGTRDLVLVAGQSNTVAVIPNR